MNPKFGNTIDSIWMDGFLAGYIQGGITIGVLVFCLTISFNPVRLFITHWIHEMLKIPMCRYCGCEHPTSINCL